MPIIIITLMSLSLLFIFHLTVAKVSKSTLKEFYAWGLNSFNKPFFILNSLSLLPLFWIASNDIYCNLIQ